EFEAALAVYRSFVSNSRRCWASIGASIPIRSAVGTLSELRSQYEAPIRNKRLKIAHKTHEAPGRLTGVSLLFDTFIPFGSEQCVVQHHCDGEWADTAWNWCDVACYFCCGVVVYVTLQFAIYHCVADIDDDCAFFQVGACNESRLADSGNDNIEVFQFRHHVFCA